MTGWTLRRSGYDDLVHAFAPDQQQAATWRASCGHSLPVDLAAETMVPTPDCGPCLIAFGSTLADGMQERHAAAAERQRVELNKPSNS